MVHLRRPGNRAHGARAAANDGIRSRQHPASNVATKMRKLKTRPGVYAADRKRSNRRPL